jgi:hypothetical protein
VLVLPKGRTVSKTAAALAACVTASVTLNTVHPTYIAKIAKSFVTNLATNRIFTHSKNLATKTDHRIKTKQIGLITTIISTIHDSEAPACQFRNI